MAAGAGNEKKRKKRNFSPAPGLNPGRQLRWSYGTEALLLAGTMKLKPKPKKDSPKSHSDGHS